MAFETCLHWKVSVGINSCHPVYKQFLMKEKTVVRKTLGGAEEYHRPVTKTTRKDSTLVFFTVCSGKAGSKGDCCCWLHKTVL